MLGVRPSYATGFAQWPGMSEYPGLWNGLVGAWDASLGATGNRVFDLSGNNHPGTFVNSPIWVPGESGPAIDFVAGSSQYIDVANIPVGFIYPPCSVVIWFKCDVLPSVGGDEYTLFRFAHVTNNTLRYQMRIEDNDNEVQATVGSGNAFDTNVTVIAGRLKTDACRVRTFAGSFRRGSRRRPAPTRRPRDS